MSIDYLFEMPVELPADSKPHKFIEIELYTKLGTEHYMIFDSQFKNIYFHKDLLSSFLDSKSIEYPEEPTKRDRRRYLEWRPMTRKVGEYKVLSMGSAKYDESNGILNVFGKSEEYDFSPAYISLQRLIDYHNGSLPPDKKIKLIDTSSKNSILSLSYQLSRIIPGLNDSNASRPFYD